MNVGNNLKNRQQLFFILSAVAFASVGLLLFANGGLRSTFNYNFFRGFQVLIYILAHFVVAIGLLLKKRPILQTGCGLHIIYYIIGFLSFGFYIWNFLSLLFWLFLLLITFLPPKASLPLAFASAAAQIVRAVVPYSFNPSLLNYLHLMLLIAGAILMGVAFSSKLPAPTKKGPIAPPATPAITSCDIAEKLIKLKSLLDDDIISQEEFEEKKKQLLGL